MDKKIKLAVAYQGDLTKMNDDIASLKSIRRQLEGQEIKLRVRLDLSGIKSDAVKAAQAYHSELTKAMAAVKPGTGTGGGVGAMSAGGIAIPTGAMQSLREFGTASGAELKRIETQFTDSKAKIVKTFEQLERGLAQTTTIRTDKKGVAGKPIISQIDTTPVEKFKQKMEEIESKYGSRYGAANGGNGDVAAVLRQKKQEIDQALIDFSHLADSPAYLKTQASLRRLDQNLSQTTASQGVRATTASKRAATNSAQGTIHSDDRKLQADIKLNKGDLAAAKAIQDRIVREKELNRVLDEREALISRQQQRYTQMQGQAQAAGHGEAAGKFGQAAARMGNDLGQVQLDRKRGASSEGSKKSEQALERSLTQVMRYNQQQRASLALEEKQASLITNRAKREETINNILARRKALMEGTERNVADIHYEASRRGNTRITGKAEKDGGTLAKQSIQDMDRVAGATRKSTLANDFHSSSLVRNAVSFTRWTLAMTAVTAPLAAISSGISDAVKLERTFKTLNAVFQGSREEAAKLADQTLMLAAANGHDGQEAAEAVIAWSRLGLTRTQALLAVETSLRAANVAEISSAEATAYLTANYKAFGQTIADIPATLDYINALSNKNAVAPKQIFEGLSRTGVVAKQAGLSLQSLASIIATVSATTQRPGAEIGNSLKTVISRLQKPKTAKDLHSEIGYDITTATGEAKSMEVVLSDLAAIYPTLNTLEQGRLKNMVAGTNQGNRFAIVMETWGEKLLAEADAADAANSAMIENAAILDSVDSKLQKLGTTWDQAFHRMGESGLFDWMGSVLTDATNIVEAFSKMGEHSVAAKVYHAGETPTSGDTDSDSPKSTALPKFSYLEKILLSAGALGGRAYDKMNGINPTSRLVTREEAQNTADGLKGSWLESFGNSISDKLEGTGSSKLIKDKFSQEATDTANSQKSVSSATTMQDWFTFRSRTADTTPKDKCCLSSITQLPNWPASLWQVSMPLRSGIISVRLLKKVTRKRSRGSFPPHLRTSQPPAILRLQNPKQTAWHG